MSVDVIIEADGWDAVPLQDWAARAADATLARLGLEPSAWDITLLACDDARIGQLNADFRGMPVPTNVLSWPSAERGAPADGEAPVPPDPADPELGDIALAFETCQNEAKAGGKTLGDHATHLVVHGILHLLGYDHIRSADGDLMEQLETEILCTLGIADPYEVQ